MSDTDLSRQPARSARSSADAAPAGFDPVDQLWRLFSSVKLALGLILGIAALSLVSVLLVQAPGDVVASPADYAAWLQRVRPRYGALTDVLSALQLFSAANSLWMRLLLSALTVNTLVCTLNRWPRIWRTVFRPTIRASDATFESASQRQELTLGRPGDAVAALRSAFARRGFRVLVEEGPITYLYADRHRFGRLGTLLTHLAIILVLAGALATSLWGFRNPEFVVPEGSTRQVGFGTGLAVKAEAFVDEYYPEGPPKDYRSDLVLYDKGVEVKRQTVRVNEPMSYGGIRFHQAFFGPAAVLQVRDEAGKVIFDDGVALAYSMGDRPVGYFDIPDRKLTGYVIGPASGPGDTSLKAGQIRVDVLKDGSRVGGDVLDQGQPKTIDGLSYTFVRERQFTGLQVVKDPGAPIIWFASALMVAGMMAVFYFPHRRYWVRCRTRADGQTQVSLAGVARRAPGFADEFVRLAEELSGRDAPGAGQPASRRAPGARPAATASTTKESSSSRRGGGHNG